MSERNNEPTHASLLYSALQNVSTTDSAVERTAKDVLFALMQSHAGRPAHLPQVWSFKMHRREQSEAAVAAAAATAAVVAAAAAAAAAAATVAAAAAAAPGNAPLQSEDCRAWEQARDGPLGNAPSPWECAQVSANTGAQASASSPQDPRSPNLGRERTLQHARMDDARMDASGGRESLDCASPSSHAFETQPLNHAPMEYAAYRTVVSGSPEASGSLEASGSPGNGAAYRTGGRAGTLDGNPREHSQPRARETQQGGCADGRLSKRARLAGGTAVDPNASAGALAAAAPSHSRLQCKLHAPHEPPPISSPLPPPSTLPATSPRAALQASDARENNSGESNNSGAAVGARLSVARESQRLRAARHRAAAAAR